MTKKYSIFGVHGSVCTMLMIKQKFNCCEVHFIRLQLKFMALFLLVSWGYNKLIFDALLNERDNGEEKIMVLIH